MSGVGHPVLAIPGFGGARVEDVYRVTPGGARSCRPTRGTQEPHGVKPCLGWDGMGSGARSHGYAGQYATGDGLK